MNKSIEIKPNQADTNNNLGLIFVQLDRFNEAINCFNKAIEINSNFFDAYNNLGIALKEIGELDKAINIWNKAINLKPNSPHLLNNMGNILLETNNEKEAIKHYDKAILIDEKFYQAFFNRGNAYQKLDLYDDSIVNYDKAIEIKQNYAEAYYNRGNSHKSLNQLNKALRDYKIAYKINPNLKDLFGNIIAIKNNLCDWDNHGENLDSLRNQITEGKNIINPFTLLSVIDSPFLQKKIAQFNILEKLEINEKKNKTFFFHKQTLHEKIKIGYFSSDFKHHAMSHLLAGMFECHDKSKFELYGFSLTRSKNDEMRKRIISSFDQFIDVSSKSHAKIAELSRKLNIDIAIDLMGFTKLNRFKIFLNRCAPIQINYLGYPGTLGSDCIDYIIADETLITKKETEHYTEKVIYLPNTYQANDQSRRISKKKFTRKQFNLPEDKFVFCCFNKKYKFNPSIFNLWMRLLKKNANSVLWLIDDNIESSKNLIKEAKLRKIDPERIIFTKTLPMEEHLARHKLADLFIDTFPYGAHTTCSDALWSGLPVITKKGDSFASRVCSSLLKAIDLEELSTSSDEEYENLALELASNSIKLNSIRKKLANNIGSKPLFNTKLFTKNIEAAYQKVHKRYLEKLPSETFKV